MKRLLAFLVCGAALVLTAAESPQTAVKPVATGAEAPELRVTCWAQGNPVKLAAECGKRPVVLFFWTISYQSAGQISNVAELARTFAKKNVLFVGVACDEEESVKKFFRLKELPFPVAVDGELHTSNAYLRPNDRVPVLAVLTRDGKVAWRGPVQKAAAVIERVAAGKFNLAEAVHQEQLAAELGALLQKQDFKGAIARIDRELVRSPQNVQLLVLKVNLLARRLKDPDGALKAIDAQCAASPQTVAFYEVKVGFLRGRRSYDAIPGVYAQMIAAIKDDPKPLLACLNTELNADIAASSPESVRMLSEALLRMVPKIRDAQEQGIALVVSARGFHFCARPDVALNLSRAAVSKLKGKNGEAAKAYVRYYQGIIDTQTKITVVK